MKERDPLKYAEQLTARADALEAQTADPMEQALKDEAEDQAREAALDAARKTPVATLQGPGGTSIALTFDQFKELMQPAQAAPTYEAMVEMATKAAHAGADRVKVKEIPISEVERKSPFNPLGDRDFPRPKLKCAMYLGAAPLGSQKEVTVLTRPEIDALNALEPGHYRIVKMDGSRVVIEVKGQRNSNQDLDRLWILLPDGDDNKTLYPPLAVLAGSCSEENRVSPGL